MSFECQRCGHIASTKSNLLKHLRKKNECPPSHKDILRTLQIEELLHRDYNEHTYNCNYCDKPFNTWQNKSRHHKICKKRGKESETDELKSKIEELSKDLETTKALLQQLSQTNIQNSNVQKITGNNNNINITTLNNNIHYHVKDFGQENISYLPKDFLSRCFANRDIVRLIENIHCDNDHPENHNIRLKSQKRNQIELRENERWIIKDEDEALTECIQNGYRILVRHAFKHKDEIIEEELDDEEEYHSIREWLEKIYVNNNEQKPIKRKILLLLLSNQALLLGKDTDT